MKVIDAMGCACPMPVIMAKKEIDADAECFGITVDNGIAVENLKKLAASKHYEVDVTGEEGRFALTLTKEGHLSAPEKPPLFRKEPTPPGEWVVFMGKDTIGNGDATLGSALAKMFFYTLSEEEDLPGAILFMNSGVKLPTTDEQVIEHLQILKARGVAILVCGTCLDFYNLKDSLKIGEVSNMYEITEKMLAASKVITL